MQLALDTVCSCFPDHYAIRQYGYIRNTLLAYPVLYEESYTWKENLLYIARTDILPKTNLPENMSLICVSRRLPKEWADSNNHIILLLNDTTVFSAFNTVFAIFQDFQNWERRLLTELGKDNDFDIQTFLRLGEEKLQNPISVSDSALRIILTSDTKQQNNPPSIDKTINISADFFPRIQDFCQTERLIKTPYLSQLTSENGIHHYCCNLYPMDYFAGCVWISEVNRPFHNADYSLADFYFSHFQKAYYKFLQMEKTTNKMASCVLKNILDHKLLSSEEEAWLTLEPDEAWMFFRLKAHPLKKPMPLDYMCAMVNILLPDTAYAVIYNNSIRGLWKCKKGTDNTDLQNLQALKELLLQMEYVAGFSSKFTKVQTIGDQLVEAGFLVRVCDIENSSEPIHFFQDYILQYWLAQCSEKLPISEFYSDGFKALLESDQKRNTSYLKTLRVYLDHTCSISSSARILYINRSSMIKRLDKIKEILKSDLSDPEERLYFAMMLRLLPK